MPSFVRMTAGTSRAAERLARLKPQGRCAAVLLLSAAALMASQSAASAADTVIKRFSSGTDRESVGMIDARQDAPVDGPQAIYAADDGSLYLLDQVNGRLLRFDAKKAGGAVQSLELPAEMRPTDVVVRRGNVYVWDGAPQALQASGRDDEPVRELTRTRTTEKPDDETLTAFAQMGSQALDSPDQLLGEKSRGLPAKSGPTRQSIATRGHGTVTANVTTSDKLDAASVEVRAQPANEVIAKLRPSV